jgi:hypothetical protein
MAPTTTSWVPFSAERIGALPETAAILEIATLVRNIVYIARAEGNLRRAAERILAIPGHLPLPAGGLYLRWTTTDDEVEALTARLGAFQETHGGELPIANRHPWPSRRGQQAAA